MMASGGIPDCLDPDSDWEYVSHSRKGWNNQDTRRGKRQRVSTGGASYSSSPDMSDGVGKIVPEISQKKFKTYETDEKLNCIFGTLQSMSVSDQRLKKVEKDVRKIRSDTDMAMNRINVLACKSIDSEARQRRNNLVFYGVTEIVSGNCFDVMGVFNSDKLGLDPDAMCIQRAHRLGSQRRGRGRERKHGPIIAAFRNYQDVELIISNAKKLKASSYGIN